MHEIPFDASTLKQYLADDPPTIVPLAIKPHWDALKHQEKLYAHSISKAAWSGTRINFRQVSPESEAIYDFIIALHKSARGNWKTLGFQADVSDSDLTHFLNYAAQFLGNGGNFKSFGDSKFIPRLSRDQFAALAGTSLEAKKLYERFEDVLYESSTAAAMHMGFPDEGHISTYYPNSPDVTRAEIEAVAEFLKDQGLMPENTRMVKTGDGNFEVLIASGVSSPTVTDLKTSEWKLEGSLAGKTLRLVFGDHREEMAKIAHSLAQAKTHSLNDTQKAMHEKYVESFSQGSMLSHVESQRHWIQDKGPLVECNIGYIETYRDPAGIRGEWEGFVAMVNQERTKAFGKLVEAAPELIPKLPWPKDFEKDKFLSPDFTSLEVLTFAGSGIPAGINIPNYDIVRQTEGFKNVSLGNVLSAKPPKDKIPFIRDEDQDLMDKYADHAFEVQVGLHELLGHGCGKLLQETEKGIYNFDVKNPPHNPVTGKPITTWYKPGETWGSVFGGMGPSYEECRAESVAMSLCIDYKILEIFGFGDGTEDLDGEAGNIMYTCYLSMARAGIAALQLWDPSSKRFGQAHMQARFAILQVFLRAGSGFCELKHTKDDLSDLTIHLDKTKIISHGQPAVNAFLQKLNVYKATADLAAGKAMYEDYTSVDEWWATKVRPEVLRQAKPRKIFVQANTFEQEDEVVLKEYDPTPEGMIQSFVDREYI